LIARAGGDSFPPVSRLPMPSHRIGRVDLTVTDLDRSLAFYRDILGLVPTRQDDGQVLLAEPDGTVLLALAGGAAARAAAGPGLFHFALLVPERRDLARALAGLRAAEWPLQGAADHAVSEALYLADPDGHGIEIYADRPRAAWRRSGGELVMGTAPLDFKGLLVEAGGDIGSAWAGLPAGTVVGHIHLSVGDLAAAERLFAGQLGMEVTVRSYPGALFLAYDGYHHHVGANVWWRGERARTVPGGARLLGFEMVPPSGWGGAPGTLAGPDAAFDIVVRSA
jgi:catechol 2,3-dioxygenase